VAIAYVGLPIDKYLKLTDPLEIAIWLRTAEKLAELKNKADLNRATMIANAVGKMLGGK
jgi:hypothetical protein